jgi:hypothetical protein
MEETKRQILARQIADLERDIAEWRFRNSQSNPGAVMELRSWRKELAAAQAAYDALPAGQRKQGDASAAEGRLGGGGTGTGAK